MSLLNLLTLEECPQCHHKVGPDQRHCPACGAEKARAWHLCPQCQTSVPADAQHCWRCGAQTTAAPGAVTFSHRWQRHPVYLALRGTLASPQERWSGGLWVDADIAAALYQDGRLLCELAPGYHSASAFASRDTACNLEAVVITRHPVHVLLAKNVCVTPADGLTTAVEVQAEVVLSLTDLPLFVQHLLPPGVSELSPEGLVPLLSRQMEAILQEICLHMDVRMLADISRHTELIRDRILEQLDRRLAGSGLRCERFDTFSLRPRVDASRLRALSEGTVQVQIQQDPLSTRLLAAGEDGLDLAALGQLRARQLESLENLHALRQAQLAALFEPKEAGSPDQAMLGTVMDEAQLTGLEKLPALAEARTPIPGSAASPPQSAPAVAEVPAAGGPPSDSTHFTASMPRSVSAEEPFEVVVWMHLAQQLETVKSMAASHHGEASPALKTKAGVRVVRGSSLAVRLSVDVPGAQVHPAEEELLWLGDITNACFTVLLGPSAPKGGVTAQCSIHCDGFKIAGLAFVISVEAKSAKVPGFVEIKPYGKAFASYASEDRDAVLARIQGMQKMRPDLDVFLDVARLRSNLDWKTQLQEAITQSDVLYLFWSAAAAQSHWVDWEWRYAWQQKGDPGVDPVPLISPRVVGPPQELSAKHFNEWMLAYMSGQKHQPPAERPNE